MLLAAVPFASQLRQRPRHLHILAVSALAQASGDQLKAPVIGEPSRTSMGGEATLPAGSRVQRELVSLNHCGHHAAVSVFGLLAMMQL
jgi:hypothetical protein